MFSFPGIVTLVFFFFVRPQEFIEVLKQAPLLYMFAALAVFGMVVDIKLRLVRPEPTPQLVWVLLFFGWASISTVLSNPDPLRTLLELAILLTWYFLISHGLQSLQAFRAMIWVILSLSLFLSFIGVHQRFAAKGCVRVDADTMYSLATGTPDGRSCAQRADCLGNGSEPGKEYRCERLGLLGTTSIAGRVRYRGDLQDPNELALVVSVSLPFVFALYASRRTKRRLLLVGLGIVCVLLCVLFTRSRGGLLAFATVLGAYFTRRFGVKGAVLMGIMGLAGILVAAAGRTDASASTLERMECWYEGMTMLRYHPFAGVGFQQFTEHHYLTAHNSLVLTAAELGIVGLFLWIAVMYTSMRIPLAAYFRYADSPTVRHWAMATIAAFSGMLVGSFFLSFSYRYMLWCYVALCGALYRVIRSNDPEWQLPFRAVDLIAISALTMLSAGGLYTLTRLFPPT